MAKTPEQGSGPVRPPAVENWRPELAIPDTPAPPEWDGTCTRLPIGFPVLRNQRVIGAGDNIVFQACQDPASGRWIGPEAAHVEDLFARGYIMGSHLYAQRVAEAASIEHQRGVYQQLQRDTEGNVIQRPMSELATRSTEQVQAEWERALAQHIADDKRRTAELRRRERQESRSGEEGAEDVAAELAKLLSGATRRAAGSEGPGTAVVEE